MSQKITITKIQAAQRQLQTAIQLWFFDGDPVSIHALAYASHEIIHKIFRKNGHRGMLFDSAAIKDEYRNDFSIMLKTRANFFKHADRDLDKAIVLDPKLNDVFLLVCVYGLSRIDNNLLSDIERSYYAHWQLHNQGSLIGAAIPESVPIDHLESLRNIGKREFFQAFLTFLRKLRDDGAIR